LDGTAKYTNKKGSSFAVKVDASVGRVVVYRTLLSGGGELQVRVDGVPHVTIPSHDSTTQWGKPFTFEIAPGNHTLEFVLLSNQYVVVEGLQFLPPVAQLEIGKYEETSQDIIRNGAWVSYVNPLPLGGNAIYSNDPNASLNFKTNAKVGRIVIYHTLASGFGQYAVTVNGETTIVNTNSNILKWGEPFVIEVSPSYAPYITLRNLLPSYIVIERIELLPPVTGLTPNIYQENDAGFLYSGNWLTYTHAAAAGGNCRYTSDPDAALRFRISPEVNRLGITWAVGSGFGRLEFWMDGVLISEISSDNPSFTWGQLAMLSLPSHTSDALIELRASSNGYVIIEQIALES
jgi:hypothetical protein